MAAMPDLGRQTPDAGEYRIDPARSSVSFVTRHMFGMGKVTGTFDLVGGDLVVASPLTSSTVRAEASVHSFTTNSKQRDKQVKSAAFLDPANHPTITFASTSVLRRGDDWVLRGRLTARGIAAPVEFVVTGYSVDGDVVTILATTRVDRYAHQVTKMKGMAARYLDLDVKAVASRV